LPLTTRVQMKLQLHRIVCQSRKRIGAGGVSKMMKFQSELFKQILANLNVKKPIQIIFSAFKLPIPVLQLPILVGGTHDWG
jgi:hypothetical protein